MAGYHAVWNCRICKDRQESIDTPKLQVCEDCLYPVAARLCKRALNVDLTEEGVDREYWLRLADSTVVPMMRRWQPAETPALAGKQA